MLFKNKTVFITGASRGIGKAIALKLAAEGANIVVAAKSTVENPKLGGTIFSAAQEIEALGAKALAVECDVRFEESIAAAVQKTVETFGGIDILINNASAISLTNTEMTEAKKYDLMQGVNVRGSFLMTKACLPYLKKAFNPHILTLSPPLNFKPEWFGAHVAYSISKYNMSMLVYGWAEEFKNIPIAVNALWPKTTIATAAVKNILGGDALINMSRTPQIVADAAFYILNKPCATTTGNHFIDEDVLAKEGITNLDNYSVVPGAKLYNDLFV
jgi:citronellol/citronellal dehydrogenase